MGIEAANYSLCQAEAALLLSGAAALETSERLLLVASAELKREPVSVPPPTARDVMKTLERVRLLVENSATFYSGLLRCTMPRVTAYTAEGVPDAVRWTMRLSVDG